MHEYVILVTEQDEAIGQEEKWKAHREGTLHRAFSVFVFNEDGALLLQQRNPAKYHSGGLWSNTCCSHPRPGETVIDAAHRRLQEEMGFDCPLEPVFGFVYKAELDHGLYEHEYDHVLLGRHEADPVPNPDEVSGWRWMALEEVQADVEAHPERYTYWFKHVLERVMEYRTSVPSSAS